MTGSGTWKSSVVLAATLGLAMTAGCTNTYRVDDTAGKSLILDAEKRVVLTKRRNGGPHVACAEPYPDLGRATNIDAGLSAGATVPAALLAGLPSGGSVQGNATATLKTLQSLMSLGTRTAGVNVLRDYAYRACEAYLNNAINEQQYDLILLGSGYTIAAVMALDGMRDINQPSTPGEMGKVVAELANLARHKMTLMENLRSTAATR